MGRWGWELGGAVSNLMETQTKQFLGNQAFRCHVIYIIISLMAGKTDYATRFKPEGKQVRQKINVALGIIRRGGSFLIQQRAPQGHLGGLWEFPGGKIGLAEAPEAGLVREIKEELGIEINIERFFMLSRYTDDGYDVTLNSFECTIKSGLPKSLNGQVIDWVALDQLDRLPMPATNKQIADRLKLERSLGLGITAAKEVGLGRAGHQGPFAIRK